MDITLTMLLDLALPGEKGKGAAAHAGAENPSGPAREEQAEGPAPLRQASVPEPSKPIRGIRIYSGAAAAGKSSRNLLYLKKQKNGVLILFDGQSIPIETHLSFAETFNKLEEAFSTLRDWDMLLHQGIIENKGLQYMIDVSEDIFRHPLTITDSGYKLIAYSKHWLNGDAVFKSAVKKGYLPADAIARLDQEGFIFEKKAIFFREAIEDMTCPMLNGTIYVEHDYRYMFAVLFPDNDYTEGYHELFAFLLGQLTLYVETNGDVSRIRHFAWMSLLADLVEGKCSPAELAERNRYSGLPTGCSYSLIAVRRKDGTMREFIQERLDRNFQGQIVFIHGESVFVLLADGSSQDGPEIDHVEKAVYEIARMTRFVAENHLYVCISDRFEDLCGLHNAYNQTQAAFTIGLRIARNKTLERLGITNKLYAENIFRYSEFYPYDLISGSASLFPAFKALLAEDRKTASGSLRLLYAYLKNDCSKTRTAAELFMHRNNIIYRISKLEEGLGLSLSDEQVKTAFRMSFLALELLDLHEAGFTAAAAQPS
ncbi:MAG: helix-turn-helix domain-containing protein [Clostridiales bacterium]|nr:helix-turn-helix domain-containing protein [Clostridiales bacterium]